MTQNGASGHQALALLLVICYSALALISLVRHGERSHCHHLTLRATTLLRDAAKCSLRADQPCSSAADRFTDATRAQMYVAAVDKIMSAQDVARLTNVAIDELRAYTSSQVDDAYDALSETLKTNSSGGASPPTTTTPSSQGVTQSFSTVPTMPVQQQQYYQPPPPQHPFQAMTSTTGAALTSAFHF